MLKIQHLKQSISEAGKIVRLNVEGMSTAVMEITGTFVGTLVFEYSIDNENWHTLSAKKIGSNVFETGATDVGKWIANVSGFLSIRIRCSAYTSGTINTYIRGIQAGETEGLLASGEGAPNSIGAANTPSIATAAEALAANANRKGWMIQNVGTNPLFVRLGGTASATVYHVVLKGGTADNDGLGASFSQMDGVIFTGAVTIAGTSPKYVILEL